MIYDLTRSSVPNWELFKDILSAAILKHLGQVRTSTFLVAGTFTSFELLDEVPYENRLLALIH